MNYLVTGGGGFIGRSLVEYLRSKNHQVFWTSRFSEKAGARASKPKLQLDLGDSSSILKALEISNPQVVFHLAAQSSVKDSFTEWQKTFRANHEGSFALFEAIRNRGTACKVVSVGSSAEYGAQAKYHAFLNENLDPQPSSPYALSKSAQSQLVQYFYRVFGMSIVHIRPFAVIGPEKRGDFVSDLLTQSLKIKNGTQVTLEMGDTQRERDFIDIEDFCLACELLIEQGQPGESYNVANGVAVSFAELIHLTAELLQTELPLKLDTSKFRAGDDQRLVADISKLKNLGYSRSVSLSVGLLRILDSLRKL